MTTLPCDAGGKRSSVGTDDRGHTQQRQSCDEALKSRNRRRLRYVWTLGCVECFRAPQVSSALTRTGGMIREQPHSHIQDHGHENYRRITSRSIGTPASLLTVIGNTEKIATDIHKNAHWQHMRTTRNGPSNLLGKD